MTLYKYTAIKKGKKISGIINADSIDEAKINLIKKNVIIIKIFSYEKKLKKDKLPLKEVFHFCNQLAKLLKAHLPLYDALSIIEKKQALNRAKLSAIRAIINIKEIE